ncbi:MAG TPA: hypothetical protein VF427_09145 [Noviherbaspirillum sp.]
MPTLNAAWRALRRFFCRTDAPAAAAANQGGADGGAPARSEALASVPAGGRLHGFYERMLEQVLEAQRNNELMRFDEIRRDRRAKRRALTLLMRLMNPEQREEFRTFRHFHVIGGGSGIRYRIRVAPFANVDVLRHDGKVRHRLCAFPAGDVPVYDVMAAQMLHLQDPIGEQRFLQRANIHPALTEERVRSNSMWAA